MDYFENASGNSGRVNFFAGDSLHLKTGKYLVVQELGSGGFGTVYHVKNTQDQEFALKLLELWTIHAESERNELTKRFEREFESGKIHSPHIVNSYHYGVLHGNPYIIMQYCPNGNLREHLDSFQDEGNYRQIAIDILTGLYDLHREGIIHRDLKPSNVLFDHEQNVKLADFGISGYVHNRMTKLSPSGYVKDLWGTMAYSPPEQMDQKRAFHLLGPVTDMFAFGVVSYEVLSGGYHPFGNFDDFKNERTEFYERVKKGRWINIRKYRPELPEKWSNIIKTCLNPDPGKRVGSPEAIIEMIDEKPFRQGGQRVNIQSGNPTVEKPIKIQKREKSSSKEYILKVINGNSAGKTFNLNRLVKEKNKNFLTLGRQNAQSEFISDIALDDVYPSYISTRHATLEFFHGSWFIRDGQWVRKEGKSGWIRSTNGTALNYELIHGEEQTKLDVGDIISVGDITLKVEIVNVS